MGRLYQLIQDHMDAQPYEVRPADVARKIGVSRQTVLNWQTPTKLINKTHLQAIAKVTGVPYLRVLDALLEDIGYLAADNDGDNVTELSEPVRKVSGDDLAGLPSVAKKRTPRRGPD